MEFQKIEMIEISELTLWSENPRDPINIDSNDFDIMSRAIKDNKKKWNLPKLINEMGNYYDFSELPTVVKTRGKLVVYDGNRRIAVLKYLQNNILYEKLGGGLFYHSEPIALKELKKIPCNVCDVETALTNVERKHTNAKDWGRLERDYFAYKHRGCDKSLFIHFEEQTGAISKHKKMNKRFVKDEILTINNLENIGFHFDPDHGIISNYTKETNKIIIDSIISLINSDTISTRNNRKKLLEPLIKNFPDLGPQINKFSPLNPSEKITYKRSLTPRKTPKTKSNNILFGKTLVLKSGMVNNFYRAILNIYENHNDDEATLHIVGMSLRIIIEIAAREYFLAANPKKADEDKVYKSFLTIVKAEMTLAKPKINFLSLTQNWLDNKSNFDAILGKFAHGNITITNSDVLQSSYIVGEILEYYYGK